MLNFDRLIILISGLAGFGWLGHELVLFNACWSNYVGKNRRKWYSWVRVREGWRDHEVGENGTAITEHVKDWSEKYCERTA